LDIGVRPLVEMDLPSPVPLAHRRPHLAESLFYAGVIKAMIHFDSPSTTTTTKCCVGEFGVSDWLLLAVLD